MKINFYLILTALCTSTCLQASQAVQKETAQHQQATPFELQMIEDAQTGSLTQETLQRYLKQGADIDAKDRFGNTSLMWASLKDHTTVVQQLISAGADINAKNNYGYTALIRASRNGHAAVVQQLIAAGADINAKDNHGSTALMEASFYRKTAVVRQLIAAGADHTIINEKDNNKTARDYAKDKDAYDNAVAAGLQERKEYLARQPQAKKIVAEQATHIPGLQDIIMGYAYGPSPHDLPPSKSDEEEKKNGEKKDLQTNHGA